MCLFKADMQAELKPTQPKVRGDSALSGRLEARQRLCSGEATKQRRQSQKLDASNLNGGAMAQNGPIQNAAKEIGDGFLKQKTQSIENLQNGLQTKYIPKPSPTQFTKYIDAHA